MTDAWSTPVVDTHVHVFKTDMPLVGTPRTSPDLQFHCRRYLCKKLDDHGIPMAVIAAASPWGDYNDYIIEAVRKYPRLRGTAILQPTTERVVLDEMKRDGVVRRAALACRHVPASRYDDLRVPPLLQAACRSRYACASTHRRREAASPVAVARSLRREGRHRPRRSPRSDDRHQRRRRQRNAACNRKRRVTWVKTVGRLSSPGPVAADVAKHLVAQAGADRMLWASDCPFVGEEKNITYQQTIDWLNACIPDPATRRQIYWRLPRCGSISH